MDFLTVLKNFLAIKTYPEDGNEEGINFLIPYFEQLGAKLVLQQVPHSIPNISKRQFNLIAIFGDSLVDVRSPKGFLMTAPVDTCPPGSASEWKKLSGNPMEPQEFDGELYGLGACSGKANMIAMLAAVSNMHSQALKQPLYLAATCGGESTLSGTKYLIQSGVVNPRNVVLGRPSCLKLVVSEAKRMVLQLKISYVAIERHAQDFSAKLVVCNRTRVGHVTSQEAQRTSIEKVFSFLGMINELPIMHHFVSFDGIGELNRTPESASVGLVIRPADLDSLSAKFKEFIAKQPKERYELRMGGTGDRGIKLLPGEVYPVLVKIREEVSRLNQLVSGHQNETFLPNKPSALITGLKQERSHLELTVQVFLHNDELSMAQIEQDFRGKMAALAAEYRSISIEVRKLLNSQGFATDVDSGFVDTLKSDLLNSGLEPQVSVGQFSSEAANFVSPGRGVVIFGAGDPVLGSNIFDEKINVSDWHAAIRFYRQAIEGFCERGI